MHDATSLFVIINKNKPIKKNNYGYSPILILLSFNLTWFNHINKNCCIGKKTQQIKFHHKKSNEIFYTALAPKANRVIAYKPVF